MLPDSEETKKAMKALGITNIEDLSPKNGVFRCRVIQSIIDSERDWKSKENNEWSIAALKSYQISNKNNQQQKSREAFRREYNLLRSFKDPEKNDQAHPHIVSAYMFYENYEKLVDYSPFYLMELGDRNLHELLADPKIKTGEASGCYSFGHCLAYLRQISDALAYLHHGGIKFKDEVKPIIHRDLKSYNILLFNAGTICKLCDFGESRQVDDIMTEGSGTKGWRAPELINSSRYTVAVDCFSLGVVIAETLFRRTPKYIGRKDDPKEDYDESDTEIMSKVDFHGEEQKVFYLSDCTFAEDSIFQENMTRMKNLLSRLLCSEPLERLKSTEALKQLEEMTPKENINLLPLWGPNTEAVAPSQEVKADSKNTTKSTTSPSVSIFYSVRKPDENAFNEKEMKRILEVADLNMIKLNTLAAGHERKPFTAKFIISISGSEMEVKIKQSRNDEGSVVQWCRDNEGTCENKFAEWFVDDPNFVKGLKFASKNPFEDYTTDFEADNEIAAMNSLKLNQLNT